MAYVLVFLAVVYVVATFLATLWIAWPIIETFGNATALFRSSGDRSPPAPVRFVLMWLKVALLPIIIPIGMLRERLGKGD